MATKARTVTEHDSDKTDRNFWVSTRLLFVRHKLHESPFLWFTKILRKKGFNEYHIVFDVLNERNAK
jgi:hypothetical protein